MLIAAVFLPIVAGSAMLLLPLKQRRVREIYVESVTVLTSLLTLFCLLNPERATATAFMLTPSLPLAFHPDGVGSVFTGLVAFLWPLATLYGFEYMEHVGGDNHFFALYTVTYGVTLGISTAANLMTLYVFYEFLTMSTIPLVMHGSSPEALHAGRQYMMYSFFGAAVGFMGVMPVTVLGHGGAFVMGGVLGDAFVAQHPVLLQWMYLCLFVGFGVKAAIFPLHAWLPTASVAPTPVTALLHAVAVVKSGVFGILRATYFSIGAIYLRGTFAQSVSIVLACVTIVYGSLMAVREHHFKRRLAYSTVSNLSYIVLAGALMTQAGLIAALTHMVFHALIKITLFFCAGAVLVRTGRTQVEQLRGLSGEMPLTCAVYTVAAMALTGTPLLPGFVSKFMIGQAALARGGVLGAAGVGAILISAVLTAIYLMSVALAMYFRPAAAVSRRNDPTWKMLVPLGVLLTAIVLCGLFSNAFVTAITAAVGTVS